MSTITPISKNILIVAGDVSGDIHAASLVRALKAADPEVRVTAIGGKQLAAASDTFMYDLASQGQADLLSRLKKCRFGLNC